MLPVRIILLVEMAGPPAAPLQQVQLLEITERYRLRRLLVICGTAVIGIASLWVPLQAVQPIADALAGQNTQFSLTLKLSIVIGLSVALTGVAGVVKVFLQRGEIRRLRERVSQLEARLRGLGEQP